MFAAVDAEVNAALDSRFRNGPDRELILTTTLPTFTRAGYTGLTEPTAASYAPLLIPAADWPAASDRAVELDVVWPDTVDDLGDIVGWGLRSGGVVAWAGRFAKAIPLAAGTSNIVLPIRVESPDQFTDLA